MATEIKNILPPTQSEDTQLETRMDLLCKLKDSTKKLLCVLEDIQSKVHSKNTVKDDLPNLSDMIKPLPLNNDNRTTSVTNIIGSFALRNLEAHTKFLDEINIKDEDDDCSVFKRLTRQCNCLNHSHYNDFVIQFNESTKYFTSTMGEVIKNVRILKNFLYIGGLYTKNALRFINEGLSDTNEFSERVEIAVACSHADICNVFEHFSIVTFCLSWPCKYVHYGDADTQALASLFLLKLAKIEEGRRYLNFTSKITIDIKKLLRKSSNHLCYETLENLNSTLNFLNPPVNQFINVTYYCKAGEGAGKRTLNALVHYRIYMTLEEIFTHLDVLHNMSDNEIGKVELIQHLPNVLSLFKYLIMEQDNTEMNIVVTSILNNLVTSNPLVTEEPQMPKATVVADISTEPIQTKNAMNQVPTKKPVKSRLGIGSPSKSNKISKRVLDGGWEAFRVIDRRSRELSNRTLRSQQAFDSSKKVNRSRTGRFESSKQVIKTSAEIWESETTYKKESKKSKAKVGGSETDTCRVIDRRPREATNETFQSQQAFDTIYKIKRSRAESVDPSSEVLTNIKEKEAKCKKEPQILKTIVGGSDADAFSVIDRRPGKPLYTTVQLQHVLEMNRDAARFSSKRQLGVYRTNKGLGDSEATCNKEHQNLKTKVGDSDADAVKVIDRRPRETSLETFLLQQSIDSNKKINKCGVGRFEYFRPTNTNSTGLDESKTACKEECQNLKTKVGDSDADAVKVIDRRPRETSHEICRLQQSLDSNKKINRCRVGKFEYFRQSNTNSTGLDDSKTACKEECQNLKTKVGGSDAEAVKVLDRRPRETSHETFRLQQSLDSNKKINRCRVGRFEYFRQSNTNNTGLDGSNTACEEECQNLKTKVGDSEADAVKVIDRRPRETSLETFLLQQSIDSNKKINKCRVGRFEPTNTNSTGLDDSKTACKEECQNLKRKGITPNFPRIRSFASRTKIYSPRKGIFVSIRQIYKHNATIGDSEATCQKESLKAKDLNKRYVVIVPIEEKN